MSLLEFAAPPADSSEFGPVPDEAPATKDELHSWIKRHLGYDVPRIAVCPDHCAPLDALWELWSEEVRAMVLIAGRGCGKSHLAATWLKLNAKFRPLCECVAVGAIREQAQRIYESLRALIRKDGEVDVVERHPEIVESIQKRTRWRNGSEVSVITGSISGVNGPHPQKVVFDEAELAEPGVYEESRAMAVSKDGIRAQDLTTSTRKYAHGRMQKLAQSITEAEARGEEPPAVLRVFCCFETAANVPNCGDGCGCDRIIKGEWDDGSPRRFSDVCGGKLARASGWVPLADLQATFKNTERSFWESQHQCIRPSTEGLVIPNFSRERHVLRGWQPDPANGPIYTSTDFGFSNPACVLWCQVLNQDIVLPVAGRPGVERVLREGARVIFDGIYVAQMTSEKLAEMVHAREQAWRQKFSGFRVSLRFGDDQARDAKGIWASRGLIIRRFATKDVKLQIGYIREAFGDGMLFIDSRVPMLCEELEMWHYPDRRTNLIDDPELPVKDFDHAVDALKYLVANLRSLERRAARDGRKLSPAVGTSPYRSQTSAGPSRYMPVMGRQAATPYDAGVLGWMPRGEAA